MKKDFVDFIGDKYTIEFTEHNIACYDVLYHVTTRERLKKINSDGLLINQEKNKSLCDNGMLFFSYPISHDTSDLFRCYDNSVIVVLDAQSLSNDGFIFYDDYWGSGDLSSKGNHLCCENNIPKKYIKKIVEL